MKKIAILGSTGSIGTNSLNVISCLPKKDFKVTALAANSNVKALSRQIKKFRPKDVCITDPEKVRELKRLVSLKGIRLYTGSDGLAEIAKKSTANLAIIAITGNASLIPLINAIDSGKDIALASKEPLVSAGRIVMAKAKRKGVKIIPVDSEHSAAFQCLQGQKNGELKKMYLTGSGGPLRKFPKSRFNSFHPNLVVKHPKWKMGRKISVDSATLMNKGLEVIEAMWLFGLDVDDVEVLIHPEAIVHSMVELKDGSILAQLAPPDMRLPIQYAISYPERRNESFLGVDFKKSNKLTFHAPDKKRFPCLEIAYTAARKGGTYPAVLNAANEEAVSRYLDRTLDFTDIPKLITAVLKKHKPCASPKLPDIIRVDKWAREEAGKFKR